MKLGNKLFLQIGFTESGKKGQVAFLPIAFSGTPESQRQRRIQNPVKYLAWNFLRKQLTPKSC